MLTRGLLILATLFTIPSAMTRAEDKPQYEFGDIRIPQASAAEPVRSEVSVEHALRYLDQGAAAWNGARKCVSCHTNGTNMTVRPALTPQLGAPPEAMRDHFVAQLAELAKVELRDLKKSTKPAQVIYTAAGLAEWDAHVSKTLSPETDQALKLMFAIQLDSGTWGTLDCWPPYESDAFHEATVDIDPAAAGGEVAPQSSAGVGALVDAPAEHRHLALHHLQRHGLLNIGAGPVRRAVVSDRDLFAKSGGMPQRLCEGRGLQATKTRPSMTQGRATQIDSPNSVNAAECGIHIQPISESAAAGRAG